MQMKSRIDIDSNEKKERKIKKNDKKWCSKLFFPKTAKPSVTWLDVELRINK